MRRPVENPFDAESDCDRHAIWEALIARDSEAFAAEDWTLCEDDFSPARFEGISGHGSRNPCDWSLAYPSVGTYRDDWLRMAHEFGELPLVGTTHRELLYRMQYISKVELADGRALVWKEFRANEPLAAGGHYQLSGQSLYRLHMIEGEWKIVGFVGYLPLE